MLLVTDMANVILEALEILPLQPSFTDIQSAKNIITELWSGDAEALIQEFIMRRREEGLRRWNRDALISLRDSPVDVGNPPSSMLDGNLVLSPSFLNTPSYHIPPTCLPSTPFLKGGPGLGSRALTIPINDEMTHFVTHAVTPLTSEAVEFAGGAQTDPPRTMSLNSLNVEPYGSSRRSTAELSYDP